MFAIIGLTVVSVIKVDVYIIKLFVGESLNGL